MGAFWLIHGIQKFTDAGWATPGVGTCATFLKHMSADTSGPYHDFISSVVLPNVQVFAHLVEWGETLVGVSLMLGLLTRLGGGGGVFLALNYWLAKGAYSHFEGYTNFDFLVMILSFLNVVLPTAATSGIDGVLAARRRARADA